jgi:hypothetical protein
MHIAQPTLESDGASVVWSQHFVDVMCQMNYPFFQYACYKYEWALRRNLCKHQIVVILTCINITQINIIKYCGTWYGFDHRKLAPMFVDL